MTFVFGLAFLMVGWIPMLILAILLGIFYD